MLKSAENESGHTDEQNQRIFRLFIPLYGNIHQCPAENAQDKQADEAVIHFNPAHALRLFGNTGNPAAKYPHGSQPRTGQIARPDNDQINDIGFGLFHRIPDFTCEQIQAMYANGIQSCRKHQRPYNLILQRQKHNTADSDGSTRQHSQGK